MRSEMTEITYEIEPNVGFCITKTVDNLPVGFNAVKNTVKYDPSWDILPHELLSNSEIKIRQEKIV